MGRLKGKGLFLLLILTLVFLAASVILGTAKKTVRTSLACTTGSYSGEFETQYKVAYFEGTKVGIPGKLNDRPPVLGVAADGERFIEVDLSEPVFGNAHIIRPALVANPPRRI